MQAFDLQPDDTRCPDCGREIVPLTFRPSSYCGSCPQCGAFLTLNVTPGSVRIGAGVEVCEVVGFDQSFDNLRPDQRAALEGWDIPRSQATWLKRDPHGVLVDQLLIETGQPSACPLPADEPTIIPARSD